MKDYFPYQQELFVFAQRIYKAGFVSGSSGNLSIRVPEEKDRFVITPTSIPYEDLTPEKMVVIDWKGRSLSSEFAPSIETPMHLAIYQAFPEVNAIIHTHAIYSTVLAVLRKPIPAILEEQGIFLAQEVPVARYATCGTKELAENAVKALRKSPAILLANHGNLCVGSSLEKAYNLCVLVEKCARIYVEALRLGKVYSLPKSEFKKVYKR